MTKNKLVVVLSCIFSLVFLFYIFKLTRDIKTSEERLVNSPNIVDVTHSIDTKLLVTSSQIDQENWFKENFNDSKWLSVEIPKHRIVSVEEFKEGSFAYYRIKIPKESFKKVQSHRNELSLGLQYVQFSKVDIYVNGIFYRTNTPANSDEFILNIPIDEKKDNIIGIKGNIKTGDSGINHRGKIVVGKGAELNEFHRHAYKANMVYSLIFILSKGSILFVFTLIFLLVDVDKFFDKFLMYGFFVIIEEILTGNFLYEYLNLNQQVYIFNVVELGILLFLFLFLSDVVNNRISKNKILFCFIGVGLFSLVMAYDLLNSSHIFNIDHLLRFWSYALMAVLAYFLPKAIKVDKVLFGIISIALAISIWSAAFSSNAGLNFKAFGNLFIFFMVAYQTFVLFRRQQLQLVEQEKDVAIGKTAAILAHDVRRPLDQMSLILNRISEGDYSEEFIKVAKQDVSFALSTVNNQINDIMNYKRTNVLNLEPISLYRILEASLKQVSLINQNVNISFEYNFEATYKILGEESRVFNVLTNVISNAFEAIRDMGKKDIGVIKLQTTISQDFLTLEIFNDGPLIPGSVLNKLFQPLSSYGKAKGTGLGLASVAKIMSEHGGRVFIKNHEKKGVSFFLNFQASQEEDNPLVIKFEKNSSDYKYEDKSSLVLVEKTKPLRVFILDDDRYVHEYFLDLSKRMPYNVQITSSLSWEDAIVQLKKQRFDIYVLDYDLGNDQTGLDFYNKNLSFLKDEVILHTNHEPATIDGLNLRAFKKPIGLDVFTKVVDGVYSIRPKILLVEDSKLISLAWRMFHGKHNIETVATPEEALSFLAGNFKEIQICVIDYYFDDSEMNGLDLADKIQRLYPNIKIAISTSASFQTNLQNVVEKGVYEVRNLSM